MEFHQNLNYSLGNEDWSVEERALNIMPGDKVVCITASGDRPLHLLMTNCGEILSIDMNPIQNYLLNLKIAAISYLDYDKYISFLGGSPTPYRNEIYCEIKSHLSKEARHFWDKNKEIINKGVIYQGKIERLTHLVATFFNIFRHKKIKTLFSFTDINEQRDFIKKKWDTLFIRNLFKVVINPRFTKYLLNDPGLSVFTNFSNSPGKYIYQKMINYLNLNLASRSPLLQLIFTGKIFPETYYPYLTFEGYKKIRRDISRLHYKTENIIEFLNNKNNEVDIFSLSDIASYMPQEIFEKLLHSIIKSAKPHARFCLREFLSKRCIPSNLANHFERNNELERKSEMEDSHFVYRFMVGEIKK